jgi:REP element-mobilizing transposase RayT
MAPQLGLRFHRRGGKRRGAGRKPSGARAGVSHAVRARFARLLPVHVTLRMARHVYNLRSRRAFNAISRALAAAAERFGMRIVQFAIEGNHVHLIVEAESNEALSRAMQGFSIRIAKRLNAMMRMRGTVLGDRYHSHVLRTPTETRRAVAYVRNNHRKHMAQIGERLSPRYVDVYSSEVDSVELPAPHGWLLRGTVVSQRDRAWIYRAVTRRKRAANFGRDRGQRWP